MKILHLIDIPWWSGLSAYAFECLAAHRDAGHHVFIACEKDSLPYKKAMEMKLQPIPILSRKFYHAPFNFFSIGMKISKIKPDCIIAHTGSTHWIAWWWGSRNKIPVIRTRTISQPVRKSKLNRRIYSESRWIVTASENFKNECLRFSPEMNGKICTIYPPVDNCLSRNEHEIKTETPPISEKSLTLSPSPLNLQEVKHSRPLGRGNKGGLISEEEFSGIGNETNKKVGLLARLDPAKGISDFLKAAKIVQTTFPDAEFHIAGSEENLKWFQVLKESKNLGLKNLTYHGFLSQNEVWQFLKSCTIGVIASTGSEEVSRALLEWFSMGKPVVATSVGCIPEILKDGEGGFLIPPNNSTLMAEKIMTLLKNPDLAGKMGRHNSTLCQKRFSKQSFQSEWEKILKNPR